MQDFITLGTAPVDESCAQVGQRRLLRQGQSANVDDSSRCCARRLVMNRQEARLAIKSFNHDFGVYYEVVCLFDTDDEEAAHYAFRCEDELRPPGRDDDALETVSLEGGHLDRGA